MTKRPTQKPMTKSETNLVEGKESWRDEYLRWLCGFANADGGTLIIGKNDRGEPVGAPDAERLLILGQRQPSGPLHVTIRRLVEEGSLAVPARGSGST